MFMPVEDDIAAIHAGQGALDGETDTVLPRAGA
jgi:hypothetical protein